MTQLLRCDQCGATTDNDERPGWLILSDLDPDDLGCYWHFCGFACAGVYATARALIDTP